MIAHSDTTFLIDEQRVLQLSSMLKVLGQPLRVQLITIIVQERLTSISTIQVYLPETDPFLIYNNLRYMHQKQLVKKLQKGREVFYGLSEQAQAMRIDALFGNTVFPIAQAGGYAQVYRTGT